MKHLKWIIGAKEIVFKKKIKSRKGHDLLMSVVGFVIIGMRGLIPGSAGIFLVGWMCPS